MPANVQTMAYVGQVPLEDRQNHSIVPEIRNQNDNNAN